MQAIEAYCCVHLASSWLATMQDISHEIAIVRKLLASVPRKKVEQVRLRIPTQE